MSLAITWQIPGPSSTFAICTTSDHVSELRITGTPTSQAVERLRTNYAVQIGRGNTTNRVQFLVTHKYNTVALAMSALATRGVDLSTRVRTLTQLVLNFNSGAVTVTLSDCAIEPWELWHQGVSVFGRYSFAGGTLAVA